MRLGPFFAEVACMALFDLLALFVRRLAVTQFSSRLIGIDVDVNRYSAVARVIVGPSWARRREATRCMSDLYTYTIYSYVCV